MGSYGAYISSQLDDALSRIKELEAQLAEASAQWKLWVKAHDEKRDELKRLNAERETYDKEYKDRTQKL